MFNTGSWPTIEESLVESADSGIESADSTANYTTDSAKVSVWVRALRKTLEAVFGPHSPFAIILITSLCAMVSIMTLGHSNIKLSLFASSVEIQEWPSLFSKYIHIKHRGTDSILRMEKNKRKYNLFSPS